MRGILPKDKDDLIYLLWGVIVGIFMTFFLTLGGFFAYKAYFTGGNPAGSTSTATPAEPRQMEIKSAAPAVEEEKEEEKPDFTVSFESQTEVDLFEKAEGLYTELSTQNVTNGRQSLLIETPVGSQYPGLVHEVFDRDVFNWQGAEAFAIDVYNDNETQILLYIKIKSGKQYPKKSFERSFPLPAKKLTTIKIPNSDLKNKLNLKEVSYLNIYLDAPKMATRLYLDNIRLLTKEDISSASSAAVAGATAGATKNQETGEVLELTINAAKVIRTINPLIYGSNLDPRAEFEVPVINFAKDIGVSNFRFPGGGSPGYRWKLGECDFSDRTDNAPLSEMSNVLKFSNMAGAQLVIQVNVESGTPQEAAEWVTFMNKSPEGLRVDYWELGNEVYGNWDKAHQSGEEYAKLIKEYAAAMKQADPTIKIGADWGDPNYEAFNIEVLRGAADDIDFVSYHWYPNHIKPSKPYQGREHPLPEEIMANSLAVADIKDRLENLIDRYAPQRKGKIELTFMEWDGSWDGVSSDLKHEARGMIWSLANAIFYADTLGEFAKQGVTVANQFTFEEVMFGLIRGWDKEAGWGGSPWDRETVRPKALAMKLFTNHFGDILVESQLSGSPTYYKERDWRADSYAGNVSYVAGYVSTFSDQEKLAIVLTNKHSEKDFKVKININDVDLQETGTAWVLNGPGLTAQNDGDAGKIRIDQFNMARIHKTFVYTVPAHSVSAIELNIKGKQKP